MFLKNLAGLTLDEPIPVRGNDDPFSTGPASQITAYYSANIDV